VRGINRAAYSGKIRSPQLVMQLVTGFMSVLRWGAIGTAA
jgi:hypothetical protein